MWRTNLVCIFGLVVGNAACGDNRIGAMGSTHPDGAVARTFYVDDLADGQRGTGSEADPFRVLQVAIDAAPTGSTIILLPGMHHAEPVAFHEQTCGNCADADFRTDIPATHAIHIAGKALTLRGTSREDSVIVTGAGYGVLFEDAGESRLESLRITGGKRDADGRATDAAVVVRDTHLVVSNVDVIDNDDLFTGQPDPIVGVAGIAAREGAKVEVDHCRILNTSWDGIASYRGDPTKPGSGPVVTVTNTLVGCTRQCVSRAGRGVGIGTTWDARATVRNTEVFGFWKGVGAFGTAEVTLTNSVIRDQFGWGVIVMGGARMDAVNNVITHNGTAGFAAWDPGARGQLVNNVVTRNGWNQNEWVGKKTGLWLNEPSFVVEYNDVFGNTPENACAGGIPGGTPCTAVTVLAAGGNLSAAPEFEDGTFRPHAKSSLIDTGSPEIVDVDHSRSDIGAFGGPAADWNRPDVP